MGLWECPPTLSTTFRSRQAEPRVALWRGQVALVGKKHAVPKPAESVSVKEGNGSGLRMKPRAFAVVRRYHDTVAKNGPAT